MGAGALLIAVAVLALVHTAGAGGEAPPKPEAYVSGYEIVNEYPHDPTAFTQGLAFGSDGTLYESDGLYRHSPVRVVELNTGKSIKSFANPSNVFGEGLVVHDNKLIQLSWKENVIHELTVPDLTLVRSLHKVIGHEGWGLASDGATLYVTDSGHELFHVDPATYEIRKRMPIIDARLYVTGKKWDHMYQVRIKPKPEAGPNDVWRDCGLGLSDASAPLPPTRSG
jgi:glutamine cyclotransferase